MLLNSQWINDQIKIDQVRYGHKWKQQLNTPKPVGWSESSFKMKVYNNISLPQERRTIPNEQSKLSINETRKRRTNVA